MPERQSTGQTPEPYEKVEEEMRRRAQQRVFEEEVEKWIKELREKARIVIAKAPPGLPNRTPTPLATRSP